MQQKKLHTWLNSGKKLVVAGLVAIGMFSSAGAAFAEQFTDVQKSHYAYEAVHWAKQQDIISGYKDKNGKATGRFGPNDVVTEAQFAKMLATYLKLEDTAGDLPKYTTASAWSDTHYDALAVYGVPLNGYFEQQLRNAPVKRGTVAQTLGYTVGGKENLQQAIDFLIAEGISTGQNPQFEGKDTLKYFGTANTLTRAQVVTFLYRMHAQEINQVSANAKASLKGLDTLTAKASVGIAHLDASLKTGNMYSATGNPLVIMTMETNEKIFIELSPKAAPNTVNNFISLANAGFYEGVQFHRVIPGFMIQGGDPAGNGAGGPGYSIAGEFGANDFANPLLHERGVISMARTSDPNSAGSQFFIMVEDASYLDGQYAAFGRVLDGMRTVDQIVNTKRNASDKPVEAQVMKKVEVELFGSTYAAPIK